MISDNFRIRLGSDKGFLSKLAYTGIRPFNPSISVKFSYSGHFPFSMMFLSLKKANFDDYSISSMQFLFSQNKGIIYKSFLIQTKMYN